jgi:hypothetical protein
MDAQPGNLMALHTDEANSPFGRLTARLAAALRRGCRRYSENVVNRVLPEAPLGGHDWFMDLSEAR